MRSYQLGLELRHVQAFRAVAETLNFRGAARRLGVAQPALSAQIRLLEARLGQRLFERSTRRVSLTDAGRRFARRADVLLRAAEDLVEDVSSPYDQGPEGRLAIWYGTQALFTVLPGLLRTLRAEAPRVEFRLTDSHAEPMVAALREERADIAFLHPPVDERGLELCPMLSEPFVAVLHREHPLARRRELRMRDLRDEPLIFWERPEGPALHDEFVAGCAREGFRPRFAEHCILPLAKVGLAAAGLGIGFVAESLAQLKRPEVVFRPVRDMPMRLRLAAARRASHRSAAIECLWELVQKIPRTP
jgi:DNA-binding transcriptional LysR family regulator